MLSTSKHFNGPRPNSTPAEVKLPPVIYYTFLLIGLSLLVFVLWKLDSVLLPITFAALFSILLLPLCQRFERWGWPRVLAILFCLLLVIVGLAAIIFAFGSQMTQFKAELPKLQTKLVQYFDQIQQMLSQRFGIEPISKDELIDSSLKSAKKDAGGYLGATLNTTADVLSVVTLVPIYMFCFLYYRDHMRQFMFRFVSPEKRTSVLHTVDSIQTVIQAYISGLMTVIVIVAILNAIGLLVLGVKFAIFFAVFASVLTIIPYIGILIGSALPAIITLVETGSPAKALGVIGVFVFVQFLEGNFITPMITGSKVSINPMAAIIALILGGELWGTPGIIISIPLIAVIKVVLDSSKATEPFGFLLGDVADGDDIVDKKAEPGFFGRLWQRLRGAS
ncbi:AI-2E family transporter [Hymenobacter qilianensis]|uniref:AI-2E family transporter n=1 Tax=Hymenobacter qilianensis TaxID=1385715 RepID=A0ACB5PQE4_9BACT|nr:AI-2E family transporter [Hymenobacter qilianensis]GGF61444.1 AI-2E family transporter [Hymenobacter qilianensis]